MYGLLSTIVKYALIAAIYLFIMRIAILIYQDISTLSKTEKKKVLGPHLVRLSGLGGKHKKNADIHPLTQMITIVGRAPTCTIVLTDIHISMQHMQIETVLGEFILTDLESANGTVINGQLITSPYSLKHGDQISIGHTKFVFNEGVVHHD